MFNTIKKNLYFMRLSILQNEGIKKGEILPFEDSLYERLNKVYFNGYPMSLQIKYLKPTVGPGQCQDRSLFITMGLDDAKWVCGDVKDLELSFGKENAWHYWVEYDGWVYDPTMLCKFKKELYYKLFLPTNIKSSNKEFYSQISWYQDIVNTKIEDLMPGGKSRTWLSVSIPLIKGIAENEAQLSGDDSFLRELNKHLDEIQYDPEQITDELNSKISEYSRKRTN